MFLSNLKNFASLFKTTCPLRLLGSQSLQRSISVSKCLDGGNKEECNEEKEELLFDPRCSIGIITGGATGIGYAAACHLLCEGAKHVIIGGINRQEGQDAIHKLNGKFGKHRAHFMDCDVTNECDFDNLFAETRRIFGYPDILFNNAGMLEDRKWSQTVDVNVKGVLMGCFLAFKYMGKDQEGGKGGVVVNNASILGFDACAGCPVYNCTKHAVVGITKALGADFHYKRTCIRVCSICPGVTTTDLVTSAKGRQYMGEWGEETARQLAQLPQQEIGAVGQAFMYIVRHGYSGEQYIIEGSQLFHAKIPPRQTFSKLKRSYKKD